MPSWTCELNQKQHRSVLVRRLSCSFALFLCFLFCGAPWSLATTVHCSIRMRLCARRQTRRGLEQLWLSSKVSPPEKKKVLLSQDDGAEVADGGHRPCNCWWRKVATQGLVPTRGAAWAIFLLSADATQRHSRPPGALIPIQVAILEWEFAHPLDGHLVSPSSWMPITGVFSVGISLIRGRESVVYTYTLILEQ